MKTILKSGVILILLAVIALIGFFISLIIWGGWYDSWSGYNASLYVSDGYCNIGVVPVYGTIVPYHELDEYTSIAPNDIRTFMSTAETDEYIQGVLVEVDSTGGYPAASATIAELFKNSSMPTAALVGDYGTSGGYMIASAADYLIGSPFSDIGGIGVTMSYLSYAQQNTDSGLEYIPLSSAPFKDYGSPDKELTAEERTLLERDLSIYHDEFVKMVAENRELPIEEVKTLADGASVPASLALEKKLIDAVGGRDEARSYFAQVLNLPEEEIIFCPNYTFVF